MEVDHILHFDYEEASPTHGRFRARSTYVLEASTNLRVLFSRPWLTLTTNTQCGLVSMQLARFGFLSF